MANVFKDILNKLNLTDDDDDFEDEGYDWGEKPAKKGKRIIDSDEDSYEDVAEQKEVRQPRKSYGKVVHMKSIQGGAGKMELRVIRPKTYDDSKEICDTLSGGMPVILNLEGLNADLAQRILDFTSGSVYAMDGNLQKVTNYIFVITPSSVDISGNFDEMLDGSIDLSGSSKYVFKN